MSLSANITNKIINYLFSLGIFAWRSSSVGIYDQSQRQYRTAPKKGVSDILAVMPPGGRIVAVEVKVGKDHLRPEQEGFLVNVERLGGIALVVKTYDDFLNQWHQRFSVVFAGI